jgi:alpha-beta hydrolase superfamily lysophospholipase
MATILAFRARPADAGHTDAVVVRGRARTLHIYGSRGAGDPVIVSSGDGGWIHLAPHVAEILSAAGFFVVGIDSRTYLSRIRTHSPTRWMADLAHDYRTMVEWMASGDGRKPVLVGVSGGAGLSVLAAATCEARAAMAGVVVLGLPVAEDLGWLWKETIGKVAPLPVAVIHSRRDELVSIDTARALIDLAGEPRRMWLVSASDHEFHGSIPELDRRLLDAIRWVKDS